MPVALRPLRPGDRAPLEAVLRGTNAFDDGEVAVALELIDLGLGPPGHGYEFLVAEEEGRVVGYACWGRTPCTDAVYDLYWIVVDARRQSRGTGKTLLAAVEASTRRSGGRMLLVETASKPSYAAQRAFYERCGFREVARVPDFYRVGDDKIVYALSLRG